MQTPPITPIKQTICSGQSGRHSLELAEFGADPDARGSIDVVFGFSNQKNRRAERIRRSSFEPPEIMVPSSASSTSSAFSSAFPQTPSPVSKPVAQKKSFFNLKNASTPSFVGFGRSVSSPSASPAKSDAAYVGLGINMTGAAVRVAPIPASHRFPARKALKAQPVSRLFKVGKGPSATYFEPVPLRQANQEASSRAIEDEHAEELMSDGEAELEDSSDDEFVSFQDSYENLIASYMTESSEHVSTGPSSLAELDALRRSTQSMYIEAIARAGPSTVRPTPGSSTRSLKRLPRKAVPAYLEVCGEVEEKTEKQKDRSSSMSPVIPNRAGSLPQTPVLQSEEAPSRDVQFSHARTLSNKSTSSSSSSLMEEHSSRASLCSSVSTLASPVSESGSMPVTPLTAAHSPQGSPFFNKGRTFELDVASIFSPQSPPHGTFALSTRASLEEKPVKSFYQNQAATQSTWAVFTSKFKQPSGPEKTRLKKFFGKS